jgi:hypothetical protein
MRLEPLYRIRFTYTDGWNIELDGGWEQYLFFAEGRCEGTIDGRFRGANFPRREGAHGPLRPDLRAVIETDDGATIMFESHGYGRAYPPGRRQIVASVFHQADREPYRRLNDVVCVGVGEVRTPVDPAQEAELVLDVAELIWEPIADWRAATDFSMFCAQYARDHGAVSGSEAFSLGVTADLEDAWDALHAATPAWLAEIRAGRAPK